MISCLLLAFDQIFIQMQSESTENKAESSQKAQTSPPLKYQVLTSLDLFKFMPVPRTKPISSKRSLYGSLLMICLFFGYFLYTFIGSYIKSAQEFATNNTPMVNQYFDILQTANISVPTIAFAFFFGDPFTDTINNDTIFTFQYQQIVKYQSVSQPDTRENIELLPCQPSVLDELGVPETNFTLLCPANPGQMSGALYSTREFVYPRIMVNYCKNSANLTCVSMTQLFQYTAGGRILLFIQDQGPDFDMTTGKPIQTIPYQTFQYFLMPGFYPRAEIYFQRQQFTILPDFFRRFSKEVRNYLTIESSVVWLTNVSIYNPYNAYQIYFRMDQNELKSFLKYLTFMDVISLWGAFWGVLFSAFAAYFLAYNQKNFYDENKEWEDFGVKIGVKKAKDTIDWEAEENQKHSDSIVFEMKRMDTNQSEQASGVSEVQPPNGVSNGNDQL